MAIQGLRTSELFTGATGQRPENWREGVLMLYPNGKAPLFGLTSAMNSRRVDDPLFHWYEQALDDFRVALGANLTTTNTTLTLAAGSNAKLFKEGDLLRVEESEEILRVSADPSSDTVLNVTRGFAGSTAATLDFDGAGVNPNLMIIGSSYEEGSLAPTGVAQDPTEVNNRTQIFRDALEATRTAQRTRLRTGDSVKKAKREALEIHSLKIERNLWFGKKTLTTKNGKALHTMDGIVNYIPAANTKVVDTDYASGLTMLGLEEYMLNIFKYGSSEKVAWCGNRAALTLQQVMRKNSTWQFVSGIKEFGMNVSRIVSPFGELVLKTHSMFNQIPGGTTTGTAYYGLDSWMFVLDMANLQYVYIDDTKFQPDIGENGLDGMKAGYLTECSIELHHGLSHYLLKNVHTAAADA